MPQRPTKEKNILREYIIADIEMFSILLQVSLMNWWVYHHVD